MAGRWCSIASIIVLMLGGSCRSVQPLRGHSPSELRTCRGWITEELPERTVARVHGHVRDQQAYPVPGVILVLSSAPPDGNPLFVATTRGDGRFVFGSVPAGRYVLKSCLLGFDTFELPVEVDPRAPDSLIDLAIRPSA
jgi:hypothetical protein